MDTRRLAHSPDGCRLLHLDVARPGPHVVAAVEPEVALAEEVEVAEVHAQQALLPGRHAPACTHERGTEKRLAWSGRRPPEDPETEKGIYCGHG